MTDAPKIASGTALLERFGVVSASQLADEVIDPEVDAYVELLSDGQDAWELRMSSPNGTTLMGTVLEFPMTLDSLWECVHDLDDEVMGQ